MNLFFVLLFILMVFLLLIKLIASLMSRVSERLLTYYFRSIEALLAEHKLPEEWAEQIKKMAKGGYVRMRLQRLPWDVEAKAFLVKKIYQLRLFFERCPFVDSHEARELLLTQIDTVIRCWEASELSDLLAYYGFTVSMDERSTSVQAAQTGRWASRRSEFDQS